MDKQASSTALFQRSFWQAYREQRTLLVALTGLLLLVGTALAMQADAGANVESLLYRVIAAPSLFLMISLSLLVAGEREQRTLDTLRLAAPRLLPWFAGKLTWALLGAALQCGLLLLLVTFLVTKTGWLGGLYALLLATLCASWMEVIAFALLATSVTRTVIRALVFAAVLVVVNHGLLFVLAELTYNNPLAFWVAGLGDSQPLSLGGVGGDRAAAAQLAILRLMVAFVVSLVAWRFYNRAIALPNRSRDATRNTLGELRSMRAVRHIPFSHWILRPTREQTEMDLAAYGHSVNRTGMRSLLAVLWQESRVHRGVLVAVGVLSVCMLASVWLAGDPIAPMLIWLSGGSMLLGVAVPRADQGPTHAAFLEQLGIDALQIQIRRFTCYAMLWALFFGVWVVVLLLTSAPEKLANQAEWLANYRGFAGRTFFASDAFRFSGVANYIVTFGGVSGALMFALGVSLSLILSRSFVAWVVAPIVTLLASPLLKWSFLTPFPFDGDRPTLASGLLSALTFILFLWVVVHLARRGRHLLPRNFPGKRSRFTLMQLILAAFLSLAVGVMLGSFMLPVLAWVLFPLFWFGTVFTKLSELTQWDISGIKTASLALAALLLVLVALVPKLIRSRVAFRDQLLAASSVGGLLIALLTLNYQAWLDSVPSNIPMKSVQPVAFQSPAKWRSSDVARAAANSLTREQTQHLEFFDVLAAEANQRRTVVRDPRELPETAKVRVELAEPFDQVFLEEVVRRLKQLPSGQPSAGPSALAFYFASRNPEHCEAIKTPNVKRIEQEVLTKVLQATLQEARQQQLFGSDQEYADALLRGLDWCQAMEQSYHLSVGMCRLKFNEAIYALALEAEDDRLVEYLQQQVDQRRPRQFDWLPYWSLVLQAEAFEMQQMETLRLEQVSVNPVVAAAVKPIEHRIQREVVISFNDWNRVLAQSQPLARLTPSDPEWVYRRRSRIVESNWPRISAPQTDPRPLMELVTTIARRSYFWAANHRALVVRLACLRHYRERGEWPKSQDDLVIANLLPSPYPDAYTIEGFNSPLLITRPPVGSDEQAPVLWSMGPQVMLSGAAGRGWVRSRRIGRVSSSEDRTFVSSTAVPLKDLEFRLKSGSSQDLSFREAFELGLYWRLESADSNAGKPGFAPFCD